MTEKVKQSHIKTKKKDKKAVNLLPKKKKKIPFKTWDVTASNQLRHELYPKGSKISPFEAEGCWDLGRMLSWDKGCSSAELGLSSLLAGKELELLNMCQVGD